VLSKPGGKSMARGKVQKRESKRKKIIEVAAKEFVTKGFQGANINRIAEKSGIGKGTIYLYFKSKEDLYVQALKENNELWMEKARDIVSSNKDTLTALKELLKLDVVLGIENKELAQLWITSFFGDNRRFSGAAASVLEEYAALVEDLVRKCIKKGVFRKVDPYLATYMLLGMNELMIAFYDALFKRKMDVRTVVGNIQDMIFKGLMK
jgi:AcrR family transcriptional regulator